MAKEEGASPGVWVERDLRLLQRRRRPVVQLRRQRPEAARPGWDRGLLPRLARSVTHHEPRETWQLVGGRRRRLAVGQWLEPGDRRPVRILPAAVVTGVEGAENAPHSLVEVRVEVAVEDGIPDRALAAAGAVEQLDRAAGLRADRHRVDDRGQIVPRLGVPLVHVLVEDVGLLHGGVDEPDADRVA